jgi:ABC-2 type transport system permease protein
MTRPGFARLTAVELRKMTDTRAGFWLQLTVVGLTVALLVAFSLLAEEKDRTFENMLLIATQPAGILLPVIGILLASSEWSQRTALITFTLVPRRGRVVVAKLLAAVVLSLAAMAACVPLAALATALSGGSWHMPGEIYGQLVVFLMAGMITGVAYGAVLLASAPAIVLYFVLPTAWSVLASWKALADVARWLDGGRTLDPLTDHVMSGSEWAHAATTLALWMVVPVLIGAWRITQREIRA